MSKDNIPPDGSDVPRHKDGRPKKRPTGDYEAGYAKPPEDTKFKKGGPNPSKGRKRGAKKRSPLRAVFEEKIAINVDGKRRRIPIGEAITMLSARDALKGAGADRRALLQILLKLEALGPVGAAPLTPEEQAKLDEARAELMGIFLDQMNLITSLKRLGLLTTNEAGSFELAAWAREEAERRRAEAHPPTFGAMPQKEPKEPLE